MIRSLPSWYGKVDDELRRQIHILANQNNIQWRFINDSKTIDESVNNIMNVLLRLKEEVRGEFNEEQIKDFKKIKEGIEERENKKKNKRSDNRKQSKNRRPSKKKS